MRGSLPLVLALSACFGRSEPPLATGAVSVDLSDGSFDSTRWNEVRGWLQLDAGSPLGPSWINTSDLVGYFHLDGAVDDVTAVSTAVAHGSPQFNDGPANAAVVLDGNAWLEIPHNPRFESPNLTVSLWVNPQEFEGTIFSKDGQGDESSNIEVRLESAFNVFVVDIETPATGIMQSRSRETQPLRWYHLVVAWGGNGTQLYIDGELIANSDTVTDPTVNDWPFLIGATGSDSLPGSPTAEDRFTGGIDEISIWSRTLTESEVHAIYDSGSRRHGVYTSTIVDARLPMTWTRLTWHPNRPTLKELTLGAESDYGAGKLSTEGIVALLHLNENEGDEVADATGDHHGTVVGAGLGASGMLEGGLAFDGDNDFVDLGAVDVRGSGITLAAWVYPTGWIVDDARIISKTVDEAEDSHTWMLSTNDPEHRLRARLKVDGVTEVFYADTAHLVANQWAHVALTYDGDEVRMYKNGRMRDTYLLTGTVAVEPTVHATIGGNADGSNSWLGTIDEVSIWERALSTDEIANLYNRGGLRTKLRVRFCASSDCTGDFVGPDGTAASFFSELLTPGPNLPQVDLVPMTSRYLQVQIQLDSDDSSFSPELYGLELEAM